MSSGLPIVILDSCRENKLLKETKSLGGPTGLSRMMLEGVFVAYSTLHGDIAHGGADGSTFTRNLAEVLKRPRLDLPQVLASVGQRVKDETQGMQIPSYENHGLFQRVLLNPGLDAIPCP